MKIKGLLILILFFLLLNGCEKKYIPKPKGYFRIDLPEHKYNVFDTIFKYKFEYSQLAHYEVYNKDSAWINIFYPTFKARIHFTYKNLKKESLDKIIDDSHNLVYKHTLKADAIDEELLIDTLNRVYGILYTLEGNAASNIQFYITDSTENFFRGALYFDVKPNYDSLKPVIVYLKEDIKHLIKSMRWK